MRPASLSLLHILLSTSIFLAEIVCLSTGAEQDIPDIQLILTPEPPSTSPTLVSGLSESKAELSYREGILQTPCDLSSLPDPDSCFGNTQTSSMAEKSTILPNTMATNVESEPSSSSIQQPTFPLPHKFYRLVIQTSEANPASPYTRSQASTLADQLIRELILTSGSTSEAYELDFVEKSSSMLFTTLAILTKWPSGKSLVIKNTNENGALYKSEDGSSVSVYLQVPFVSLSVASQEKETCGGSVV